MAKKSSTPKKQQVGKPGETRILVDRSGSMSSQWDETVGSVNAYAESLAKNGAGDSLVTVVAFDGGGGLDYVVLRNAVVTSEYRPIALDEVQPRGMTPLSDAIGRLVNDAEASDPERCVIVIMTDGHENASRELSVADARAALDRCKKRGWEVIFLGADFADNSAQATSYGVDLSKSVNTGKMQRSSAMRSLSGKTSMYFASASASAGGAHLSWTDEERTQVGDK